MYICMINCCCTYMYIEEPKVDMGRVGEGGSGKTYVSCTFNT